MIEKAAYSGSYDLKNLPPTETASEQHSYRTYHQLQMWLGNKKDSTQWGWQVTENGLQPVLTENGAYLVPEDILKTISCSCKTGCNSTRCGCRKVGLKCTHLCSGCSGENCSNIIKRVVTNNGIINEYEEDMMETDDNTEVIDDMRAEEIDEEEEEGQEEMIEDEVDLENQSNYSEATTKRRRIK